MKLTSFMHQGRPSYGAVQGDRVLDLGPLLGAQAPDLKTLIAKKMLPLAAQAQKLMSPAEMGELFKVIAVGSNHHVPLAGFSRGNQRRLL